MSKTKRYYIKETSSHDRQCGVEVGIEAFLLTRSDIGNPTVAYRIPAANMESWWLSDTFINTTTTGINYITGDREYVKPIVHEQVKTTRSQVTFDGTEDFTTGYDLVTD